ncbi:MAG: hypothetical protein NC399_02890 [Muribaculum sp.]|nr:hypothetical protein [Muribaculum sp.]
MAVSKIQTGLRIDETTYGKLKTLSETENRSLNNLVEFIIKKYLSDYEKESGTIPIAPYPEN